MLRNHLVMPLNNSVVGALFFLVMTHCVCSVDARVAAELDCPAPSHAPEDRRSDKSVLRFMVTALMFAGHYIAKCVLFMFVVAGMEC